MVLGLLAAPTIVISYSVVKTGSPLPGGPLWTYLAIAGGAPAVTVAATVLPAVRATGPGR